MDALPEVLIIREIGAQVLAIIGACAAAAAVLPKGRNSAAGRAARKVLDVMALNVGNSKNEEK